MSSSVHAPGLAVSQMERTDGAMMVQGGAVCTEVLPKAPLSHCGCQGGVPDLNGLPRLWLSGSLMKVEAGRVGGNGPELF